MASEADWDETVPAEAVDAGRLVCWRCMAEVMPEVKLCAGSWAEAEAAEADDSGAALMETGECVDDVAGTGETGDGVGTGAWTGSWVEGTGWAAGYAESEIAGIAVVCCGDCGVGKVGTDADEAIGWEIGTGVDVEAGSMGAETGGGIEAGAACVAMAPGSWMTGTSGEAGAGDGGGSC